MCWGCVGFRIVPSGVCFGLFWIVLSCILGAGGPKIKNRPYPRLHSLDYISEGATRYFGGFHPLGSLRDGPGDRLQHHTGPPSDKKADWRCKAGTQKWTKINHKRVEIQFTNTGQTTTMLENTAWGDFKPVFGHFDSLDCSRNPRTFAL